MVELGGFKSGKLDPSITIGAKLAIGLAMKLC